MDICVLWVRLIKWVIHKIGDWDWRKVPFLAAVKPRKLGQTATIMRAHHPLRCGCSNRSRSSAKVAEAAGGDGKRQSW